MGKKVLIASLFIAGFSLFFYPFISHWFKTKTHYEVMSTYDETLEEMTEEGLEKELEKAREHNEEIHANGIPLLDPFSDEAEDEANVSYFNMLQIDETMGHLEIPSINVHLPIYHGISERVLTQGVGHMSNSSLPVGGQGTHAALTAHRGLPSTKLFRNLDEVEEGDVFFIHSLGETLAYEVDDIEVVLPSETNWLDMDAEKDYVTLITCEPYMINTHRLLVRGERIPYQEDLVAERSDFMKQKDKQLERIRKGTKEFYTDPIFLSSVTVTVISFSLFFVFLRRRRK